MSYKITKEGDSLRRIEMEYFDTYYFCSIAQYLMEEADLDFASTLAEFTDQMTEREDFPKESYLHNFVEFMVERILFEQNKYMASDIGDAINESGYNSVILEEHKVFQRKCFGDDYRYTTFELAILHYHGTIEKMKEWIAENVEENRFDYLEAAAEYTNYLEDNYYDVIDNIKREVLYLLFQNRNFLMHFNIFMSDALEGKSIRKNLPQWVKRAVFYRDNGKCVICQKDLSGLVDVEEDYEKQFDHIVPLEEGGLNDISNIQLMCRDCNRNKGTETYTSNVYRFLYDD